MDLSSALPDDFRPFLNSSFEAANADEAVQLQLAEVSELESLGAQERFSLVFTGPESLPQGIYSLALSQSSEEGDSEVGGDVGGALDGLELFLVPIGPGSDGKLRYEAAFSRLTG